MNYYQKIYGFITFAIVGMTLSIIGVCFNTPYSDIFITECIMIFFSELLIGTLFINQVRKSDSILPYSLASIWIGLLYLLFVFIMIIPACFEIKLKYFILLHIIGGIFTGIVFAIFRLGEHNINEQEVRNRNKLSSKKSFYLQMNIILDDFILAFPDESDLKHESKRMLDNLRYASNSEIDTNEFDSQISELLGQMKSFISSSDIGGYRKSLNLLKKLYHAREEKIKLY